MILTHFPHNNKHYAREGSYIAPRVINRFWLRRLCEATLFIGLTLIFVYAWARFMPGEYSLPVGLAVSDITAAIAAVTSIVSLVFCFWLPKNHTTTISTSVYLLAATTIGSLIFTSGGTDSPFISAWLIVALFAGFFGTIITGLMAVAVAAQIFMSHTAQALEIPSIITYVIFGVAPLILSFVLWHRQPEKKTDNTFRDLANRLSTVEGKSDVVINSIDDGVMAINRSGIIDLINPAAQTLVGWNQGDALGLDWRSVFKLVNSEGREVQEIDNPVAQALANNKPAHSDKFSVLTGSDKKRLVSVVSSPVGQGDGGIIVIFRDITKEKAEEREQAEFISTASHEMRTPVASIEGYLGLALNPATAQIDEKARDFITKAHESARHLGELFQNLLDISKAEDGRLKNEPQVIDVSSMTGDILGGLNPLAQQKQLRMLFKPNPTLENDNTERRLQPVFYAHVDPSHFREVISNLIENAIKYTLQGDIVVDVAGDEKIVTVSVQDSGVGIPAEDLPHLFQKFYRVDNTDTREIGGTGLGLYLCRRLAEIMGGSVRVESQYKKGSTFYLDIPRLSHEDAMRKLSEVPEDTPQIVPDDKTFLAAEPLNQAVEASQPVAQYTQPTQPVATQPAPQPAPVAQPATATLADIENSIAQPQQPVAQPVQPVVVPVQPTPQPVPMPTQPAAPQPMSQPTPQPVQQPAPTPVQQPQLTPTQTTATQPATTQVNQRHLVRQPEVEIPERGATPGA